jgi:hypothetical protein
MSRTQTLAALKAAEPVLADLERILNKRIGRSDDVQILEIPELKMVREAIRAHERICIDQGCCYFGSEAPKGCGCHA